MDRKRNGETIPFMFLYTGLHGTEDRHGADRLLDAAALHQGLRDQEQGRSEEPREGAQVQGGGQQALPGGYAHTGI